MDRTKYLQLCQKYAVFKNEVVKFKNIEYYPCGYVMQFDDKGNPLHFAMLQDKNKKTIVYSMLKDVE